MPFTLCHAAAAVPLRRWGLSLSALAIGSMSPDFLYYLHVPAHRTFGHSLAGLFLFCLPAALLALAVWHGVMKQALLALLPEWAQAKLQRIVAQPFAWRGNFGVIAASVLVGALTHVIWDGLTHRNGWAVRLMPELGRLILIGPVRTRPFYILQDLSTLLGGALLLLWGVRWLRAEPALPVSERLRHTPVFKLGWIAGILVPSMLIGLVSSVAILYQDYQPIRRFIVNGLIATITAMGALTLAFCLYWRSRSR
jgi:hypothetical protein